MILKIGNPQSALSTYNLIWIVAKYNTNHEVVKVQGEQGGLDEVCCCGDHYLANLTSVSKNSTNDEIVRVQGEQGGLDKFCPIRDLYVMNSTSVSENNTNDENKIINVGEEQVGLDEVCRRRD